MSVWDDSWGYVRDEALSARPAWAASNRPDRPERAEYADLEEQS